MRRINNLLAHRNALETHASAAVRRGAETEGLNVSGDCRGLDALADRVGSQHVRIVNALGARADFLAPHVDVVAASERHCATPNQHRAKHNNNQTLHNPRQTPSRHTPVGPVLVIVSRHGVEGAAGVGEPVCQ